MSLSKVKRKPLLLLIPALLLGFAISFAITSKIGDNGDVPVDSGVVVRDGKTIHEVALTKNNKEPIDLVLKTGEYVQFNSKDGGEHQIIQGIATADHGPSGHTPSPLDSGIIKNDEGYLLQFNQVGKYDFHDNYNHHYTITVIVYDPSKSIEDIKLKP